MKGNFGLDFSLSQFTCDETDVTLYNINIFYILLYNIIFTKRKVF